MTFIYTRCPIATFCPLMDRHFASLQKTLKADPALKNVKLVTVSFDAQIEQLVQFLADLTTQKQLIATNEIRIGQAHPKQKSVPVRLTVSGIVKKSLLPAKKGPSAI